MINRIKQIANSLWTNHIFKYSLSWSLILSGIIFSLISMYVSGFELQQIISDIIIIVGLFLNPELDVDIITKSIYHLAGFLASLLLLFTDLQLITDYLLNGNTLKYILILIITIPLLTYYIFLTYSIISKSFDTIRNNTNNISKFLKYAGVAISFLISVATLLDIIMGIKRS